MLSWQWNGNVLPISHIILSTDNSNPWKHTLWLMSQRVTDDAKIVKGGGDDKWKRKVWKCAFHVISLFPQLLV